MGEIITQILGEPGFLTVFVIAVLAIVVIAKTATVVPQQSAYVVQLLGKYSRTLKAGFHILIPFIEKISYKHSVRLQTNGTDVAII